jgi:hypothetical protein
MMQPFAPRTTEAIERANRLLAFRDSPAFNEVFRVSQSLVDEARANQRNFGGWDRDQIVTLAIRVQVAEQFHERLFSDMAEAITLGVAEAANQMSMREAADASDALRDQVLRKMDTDSRVPGSH